MHTPSPAEIANSLQQSIRVQNVRNGNSYSLVPITEDNVPDERHAAATAAICNEPLIYNLLFAERCSGNPYALADAERFLNFGRRGWRERTHFVYLICDFDGNPAGAIDIKSADLFGAEIGYWLSSSHSGVMTNAVIALCELARGAGYQSLYARVRTANERSANVLRRAGFDRTTSFTEKGIPYDRWELPLVDRE